jgi:hypothetical protein
MLSLRVREFRCRFIQTNFANWPYKLCCVHLHKILRNFVCISLFQISAISCRSSLHSKLGKLFNRKVCLDFSLNTHKNNSAITRFRCLKIVFVVLEKSCEELFYIKFWDIYSYILIQELNNLLNCYVKCWGLTNEQQPLF